MSEPERTDPETTSTGETTSTEDKRPSTSDVASARIPRTDTIFYQLKFWVGMSVILAILLVLALVSATIAYRNEHDWGYGHTCVINNYYQTPQDRYAYPEPVQPSSYQPGYPYSGHVLPQSSGHSTGSGHATAPQSASPPASAPDYDTGK